MRIPAPSRIADCTARFIARRVETRRSSCCAMPSATSFASISGVGNLKDVQMHVGLRQFRQIQTHFLDVGAFLANHHARPRRMDGNPRLLRRTLDDDARNACRRAMEKFRILRSSCSRPA